MFWVCERSRAASTSSRMYNGAGLKRRRDRMRERATSDLKVSENERVRSLKGFFESFPNPVVNRFSQLSAAIQNTKKRGKFK